MSAYFWFQQTGGEDKWQEALAEHRAKVIAELHPAFTTVLDAHSSPTSEWGREEYAAMKYSGDFYTDFDADDVSETIPEFKKYLAKLAEAGVNLEAIRLYATGGRGFHCEVPAEMFMPKVPRTGTQSLPYIFREMALELIVATLDMRVFTARKGRMWRTPNIQRSNGKYKVGITLAEALNMTPELFDEVCSAPRAEPERQPPTIALGLSALFVKSQAKVNEAVKRQVKAGPESDALLAKFKGTFPESLAKIMAGDTVRPDIGFHRIALQLSITANAMGKTAKELTDACEGLIKSHQSDSSRYSSPRKRREELERMWSYTQGNPCYSFSPSGIRSLMEPGTPSGDLDLHDRSEENSIPMGDDATQEISDELAAEIKVADASSAGGIIVHRNGIYARNNEGVLRALSHISLTNPTRMVSADTRLHEGFECDIFVGGVRHSTSPVPLDTFKSRAQMHQAFSNYGGTFLGNDLQAGAMLRAIDTAAKNSGREVYMVHREGLDIVQDPTVTTEIKFDVIWAAPDAVLSANPNTTYRFSPLVATKPIFRTDIHHCEPLTNTPEIRAWLHHLLQINQPIVVAQMLGWFVSALHKQFYQVSFNQFPLLHPNGSAGSGKTLTTLLFGRLWHNATKPQMQSCSSHASTGFALKSAWTGSSSIPLILDEYKPSELGPVRHDYLLQIFRLSYNQGLGSSGGMSRGGATSSFRDVTQYAYSAPVVFLGETQETQTAMVQRTLPVSFTANGKEGRTKHFIAAQSGSDFMPRLGKALLLAGMRETVGSRKEALDPLYAELRHSLDKYVHDRQVYNLAIVLAGLNFLDTTLEAVFDNEFKPAIDVLRQSVYTAKAEVAVQAINEAAKALNDMAFISRTESVESEFAMREGIEYIVMDGYVEILMRESFVKYFAWNKRKGFTPLFSTAESFLIAMAKFEAVTDKLCFRSPIKATAQSRVFRFDLQKLQAEGVELFKTKLGG